MSVDSTLGVGTMKRHEQYYFRDGNVSIQVENTVFRLHRHFFERESDYFRDLFGPSSEGNDFPVNSQYVIHDVKSEEFADFVWVWYNPRYSFSKQDKKKWLTVLRLATQWHFGEIRNLAIRQLEKIHLDPIEKIKIYKQYAVDAVLLLPSYTALCTSPTLPSPAEGQMLTMDTVLRVASAREKIILRASELGCKTPTVTSAPEDVTKSVVAESFDLTLHPNDETVRMEGQNKKDRNASNDDSLDTEVVTVKQPIPNKAKANGGMPPGQEPVNGIRVGGNKGKQKER